MQQSDLQPSNTTGLGKLAAVVIVILTVMGTFIFQSWRDTGFISASAASLFLLAIYPALAYRKPAILIALLFISNHFVANPGFQLIRFVLLGVILLSAGLSFFENKYRRRLPPLIAGALIFLYYALIVVVRPDNIDGLWLLLHLESFFFFLVFQALVFKKEDIHSTLFFHLVFLNTWGCIEWILINRGDRVEGPVTSATAFGVMLAVVWVIWMNYALLRRKDGNPEKGAPQVTLAAGMTIWTVLTMVGSGTRMTFIGVFLGFLFLAFNKTMVVPVIPFRKRILQFSLTLALVAGGAMGFWKALPDTMFIKQGFSTLGAGELDMSSVGRIAAWYSGVHAYEAYPIFGIGSGNFQPYMEERLSELGVDTKTTLIPILPHAHNLILILLSENGIIGLVVMSIIVLIGVFFLLQHLLFWPDRSMGASILAGFLVMLALGMLDAVPLFPSTLGWGAWLLSLMYQLPGKNQLQGTNDDGSPHEF